MNEGQAAEIQKIVNAKVEELVELLEGNPGMFRDCPCPPCQRLRAALDELKVAMIAIEERDSR